MGPVVEKIEALGNFMLGEGPHWDHQTQSLYFVDILKKTIHKYIPSLEKHTYLNVDKMPSFIIPITGSSDRFLISLQRDIAILTWNGIDSTPTSIKVVGTVDCEPELENNRINDGKADPLGNLWAGTMAINADLPVGPIKGTLYSLTSDKKIKSHATNIAISNGLAWSKDLKKMYYIDSAKRGIDQYDFDASTLSISNCQPLFTFEKHQIPGYPDGQTIDADGNLWVAVFQGNRVIKISSDKPEMLLETIEIPDHQVTSVAFGGPNLDVLYVTSAGIAGHGSPSSLVHGHIYKVTGLGVKGLPGDTVKI